MRCKAGAFSRNQVDVSLLLHFDGSNNSTTFTDSSTHGHTLTAVDDAVISTAQSKFGGASGLFGSGDRLDCAATTVNDFGTGDFTIECWVRFTSTSGRQIIYEPTAANQIGIHLYYGYICVEKTAQEADLTYSNFLPETNTWHHIAVTKGGGLIRLWKDGVLDGGALDTSNYAGGAFTVGGLSASASESMKGHIDEFRITKNLDRYQGLASFTPSTTAFPDP